MGTYDYLVVGFYMLFMFVLGPVYKNFSKTSSDFFRGGGAMIWWVVGSSAFMTSFSAWAFTGGAAKAYKTGSFYLLVFACNIVSLIFCYFCVVARYRRMRIITIMEGVRKRYGKTSEQVLTWLLILTRIFTGGMMLYAVGVFMGSVFDIPEPIMNGIRKVLSIVSPDAAAAFGDVSFMVVLLGATITLMTAYGGSWSATAGDFVQMLVIIVITVTMAALTLVKTGGVQNFVQQIPEHHMDWTLFERPGIIVFFVIALCINQLIQMNSLMEGAARYIFAKDSPSAKKAILLNIAGFVILPIIWIIPAMMAANWYPDMASMYPGLNTPEEATYVALASDLLPTGLFGLLVCGIFAATVTSCNSQLNIVGGSFVRNIWIQVIRPKAKDAEQIFVGRIAIVIFGTLWILLGIFFQNLKGVKLFDLMLMTSAAIGLPMAVPLFLGIFIKKTPAWSGWTTMVAGFIPAILLTLIYQVQGVVAWLWRDPDMTIEQVFQGLWPGAELNG
ncbi:hypothetical protein ACFL6U_31655, partial [Planctomycetota bacterium]